MNVVDSLVSMRILAVGPAISPDFRDYMPLLLVIITLAVGAFLYLRMRRP